MYQGLPILQADPQQVRTMRNAGADNLGPNISRSTGQIGKAGRPAQHGSFKLVSPRVVPHSSCAGLKQANTQDGGDRRTQDGGEERTQGGGEENNENPRNRKHKTQNDKNNASSGSLAEQAHASASRHQTVSNSQASQAAQASRVTQVARSSRETLGDLAPTALTPLKKKDMPLDPMALEAQEFLATVAAWKTQQEKRGRRRDLLTCNTSYDPPPLVPRVCFTNSSKSLPEEFDLLEGEQLGFWRKSDLSDRAEVTKLSSMPQS
ncbi:hypothetical protein AaE_015873 [Aphanomyces astaci]|uniref:Uncharacterized protein n=1 Tax=Aphanomyces astaci TaxID=112090 RepID=A0A6A4Z0C5_APHAT|nr:hypothetical protein AaE_015873 [Aphanomyces astaci]